MSTVNEQRQPGVAGHGDEELTPRQLAARYNLTVSGQRPSLSQYVRQLWGRRHFILSYSRARMTAMYSRAKIGQLWTVMTPLLNACVYYLIFGVLLNTNRGVSNFIPYLVTGLFIYHFTQTTALSGTRSIADNLGLLRALHFPRACLPISMMLVQLQQLLVSMVVLAIIVLSTGEPLGWTWFLAAPILALQAVFNGGLALGLARIGAKVTDTAQLMPFILRTWMYGSGVLYSIDQVTQDHSVVLKVFMEGNPLAIFINLMRSALMESYHQQGLPPYAWLIAAGWALLVGVGGFVFFWKAEEEYGRG